MNASVKLPLMRLVGGRQWGKILDCTEKGIKKTICELMEQER